jgi:predicted nucleic-acid-binding Zn-ribbon protein
MNDMRRGTCPLCGHNEIIEARPRVVTGGLFIAVAPGSPGVGNVWSYSCRRCDYTQLFAQETAKLPIGAEHGTRIVMGPAPEPFR